MRKQVTSTLLWRQPHCRGKWGWGRCFRDNRYRSRHSWVPEKNNCFQQKPPKYPNAIDPVFSLWSKSRLLGIENVRTNCRDVCLRRAFTGLSTLPLFWGKVQPVSKLPSEVCSLTDYSCPSVPTNYECKSNN